MEARDVIRVSLLGDFTMRHCVGTEEYVLTERDSTSKLLWTFLEYLSFFSKRGVTQGELIEVLWGDSEGSRNPANTLKTLLHRGRAALERLGFPDGKQVLLYRRGLYTWSPEVSLELDTDQFDLLCAQSPEENPESVLQALQLYQGDFLPSAMGSPWAVSLRTYYHTKFLRVCRDMAVWLLEQQRYAEAEALCRRATVADPYDEPSHLLLMRILAASGAQQAAIQHYTQVTKLFMDQLGVSPSESMRALYRELTKADSSVELDLDAVRKRLQEFSPRAGAYFCEYGVFQDIYRLEARNAVRSGRIVQLAMLTVLDENEHRLLSKRCSAAMEELRSTIHSSLRAGDTFTRFSASQYLLLLPTTTYENGVMVLQRILNAFETTLIGRTVRTEFSLLPVLPVQDPKDTHPGFTAIPETPG